MRHSWVLLVGLLCRLISSAIGSYDGYGATHGYLELDDDDAYEPSYPAPPLVHSAHPPPAAHGHSAGSYYHYHVPLVQQQQQQQYHYPPHHYHQDNHHNLLWPLLLLLALAPLLLLPLLPLLLIPLGLSLLALLGGGGMMMMMMMMMMGGEMMMRRDTVSGRALNEMRTFGDVIYNDMSSLLFKYARSLDLDQCPQLLACELGSIFVPDNNNNANSTESSGTTAKAFVTFMMDQYVPKGRVKRALRQFQKAFWSGLSHDSCGKVFQCQPSFRMYPENPENKELPRGSIAGTGYYASHFNETTLPTGNKKKDKEEQQVRYVYPSVPPPKGDDLLLQNNDIVKLTSTESPKKLKFKRSHYSKNGGIWAETKKKPQDKKFFSSDSYYGVFGTPTVKS